MIVGKIFCWVKVGMLGLVGFLVMIGVVYMMVKVVILEVVVFDMKGIVDLFMQQFVQLQFDEDKVWVLIMCFNIVLLDSFGEWQVVYNVIILVKLVVMSLQWDIMNEICVDIVCCIQGGQ